MLTPTTHKGLGAVETLAFKMWKKSESEEITLLHDLEKLFFINHSISVFICVGKHLLQLGNAERLIRLLGNTDQILQGDSTCFVCFRLDQLICLQHVILGVFVEDLVRHHLQELWIPNLSAAIIVDLPDHLLDLPRLRVAPKRFHRDGQLFDIDIAISTDVEEVEGLLDVLLLFSIELCLLFSGADGHGGEEKFGLLNRWTACC